MSKFNHPTAKPVGHGPIVTDTHASGHTHEGAPGYARDNRSELFLLAVSNMVGEDSYYEKAGDRDNRFRILMRAVARKDPEWMLSFVTWLRGEGNMRSASLVAAAEAVKVRLEPPIAFGDFASGTASGARPGINRQLISAVLQRADEPGEMLAYWMGRYGRNIPKPVRRGIGDAVRRLYTERNLLKYDTSSHAFRFGDVLDLTHPEPVAPWQGALFKHALDRRHNREEKPSASDLPMLSFNQWFRGVVAEDGPEVLLNVESLQRAGMTWEDALSLAGSGVDKGKLWEALIPTMGYMALLRNLRNFDQAGVSDAVAANVSVRIADTEQVAKSRQFPFRFLAAYRNVPSLRWGYALDRALTASMANIPTLPGRTLILIDVSGSMQAPMSGKSELTCADAAKAFGCAVAMRSDAPTLAWFNDSAGQVFVPSHGSLLKLIEAVPQPRGGTYTAMAVQKFYAGHDRVIIITDEQQHAMFGGDGNPGHHIPPTIPLYTWNLAGHKYAHAPGDVHRHSFGGLTDAAFRLIPLIERGRASGWPWAVASE